MLGVSRPTIWKGLPGHRGRPGPQSRRFLVGLMPRPPKVEDFRYSNPWSSLPGRPGLAGSTGRPPPSRPQPRSEAASPCRRVREEGHWRPPNQLLNNFIEAFKGPWGAAVPRPLALSWGAPGPRTSRVGGLLPPKPSAGGFEGRQPLNPLGKVCQT